MSFPIHLCTCFTSLSLDTGSAGWLASSVHSREAECKRASERALTHSRVSSGSFSICLSRCDLVKTGIPVYTVVWVSKQHISFGPWIEHRALKCPLPPSTHLALEACPWFTGFTAGQGVAESQICRNKALEQSMFRCLQYLLPGQKSDKDCSTEGQKF